MTTVLNQDVAGLCERIDEVIYELQKSQSASVTDFNSFDRTRIDSYLAWLDSYVAWILAAPAVDVPETHPREYVIKEIASGLTDDVENKSIRDIIRMFRSMMTEMSNAQSSRNPNGLISHDANRYSLLSGKIAAFLTNHIDQTLPVDMPESSPSSEITGAGLGGI